MNTYFITAYDYTTSGTLEKRLAARPDHLAAMQKLKEKGNFVTGGAFLNEKEEMIGSALILQFETEQELEHWKANDPYVTSGVWERVEVKAFKIAQV